MRKKIVKKIEPEFFFFFCDAGISSPHRKKNRQPAAERYRQNGRIDGCIPPLSLQPYKT